MSDLVMENYRVEAISGGIHVGRSSRKSVKFIRPHFKRAGRYNYTCCDFIEIDVGNRSILMWVKGGDLNTITIEDLHERLNYPLTHTPNLLMGAPIFSALRRQQRQRS